MPRPSRPLTEHEKAKPCGLCNAQPGERCTNPNGSAYPYGEHAARRGGRSPRRRGMVRDSGESYPVQGCRNCQHPGGQHLLGSGCRLCRDCPGWEPGGEIRWTDRMTGELLAAMTPEPEPCRDS